MRSLYLSCRRRAMHALLACALLLWVRPSAGHGTASLDARLERRANQVELRLRLSLRDLRHLVEVDRDGDGQMTPTEVLGVRAELQQELQGTLQLVPVDGPVACPSTLASLALADLASVDVVLRFSCPDAAQGLELISGLFGGSGHLYTLTVQTVDHDGAPTVLTREHHRARLPAPDAPARTRWLWLVAAAALGLAVALGWRWRTTGRS